MFFLSTGTSGGYSQWVGTLDGEVKRGHHILCKSVAAMPYLNRPHKRRSWWRSALWWWAEPNVDKDILSYPAPSKVDGRVVTFVDGRTFEADVIVQATGYSQRFPFLHGRENGGAKQPQLVVPYNLDTNDMRFATPQGFNSGEQFFSYLKDSISIIFD